jgi:hypothetical protein
LRDNRWALKLMTRQKILAGIKLNRRPASTGPATDLANRHGSTGGGWEPGKLWHLMTSGYDKAKIDKLDS